MSTSTLSFLAKAQRAADGFFQKLVAMNDLSLLLRGFAVSRMEMRLLAPPVRVRDSQPYLTLPRSFAGVENLQQHA